MPSVLRRPATVLGIAVASLLAMASTGPGRAMEGGPQSLEIDFGPNGVIAWSRGSTPVLRVMLVR